MNKNELFICVGENYIESYFNKLQYGDIFTLKEIVKKLFLDRSDYFNDFSKKELLDYIYKNCGKRLIPFKEYNKSAR